MRGIWAMSDTVMRDLREYLMERKATLEGQRREVPTRLDEIMELINAMDDGRTRLGKQARRRGADGTGASVAAGAAELPLPDRQVAGSAHREMDAEGGMNQGDGQ